MRVWRNQRELRKREKIKRARPKTKEDQKIEIVDDMKGRGF